MFLQVQKDQGYYTPCLDQMTAVGLIWANEDTGCSYVSGIRIPM